MSSSATRARDGARARIASAAPTESAAAAHTAGCTPLPQSRAVTRNHRIDTESSAAPATRGHPWRSSRQLEPDICRDEHVREQPAGAEQLLSRRARDRARRASRRGTAARRARRVARATRPARLGTGIAVATTSRSAASRSRATAMRRERPSGVREISVSARRPREPPSARSSLGAQLCTTESPSLRT